MKKVFLILVMLCMVVSNCFGGADFDGTDDYLDIGNMGSFGSALDTQSTSVSFWFKSTNTSRHVVFGTGNNTGNDTAFFLHFNVNISGTASSVGRTWQRLRDEDAQQRQGGSNSALTELYDGSWHHWVSIFHVDSEGEIYLDGVKQTWTTGTAGATNPDNTANFTGTLDIGGMNWKGTRCTDGCFDGDISEFYIFSDELTDEEVLLLATSKVKGLGRQLDNMTTYIPIDDEPDGTSMDGDTARDYGTGRNDGTGVDGANNTGLTATAETVLTY